jgi:hypothetical protein
LLEDLGGEVYGFGEFFFGGFGSLFLFLFLLVLLVVVVVLVGKNLNLVSGMTDVERGARWCEME